MAVRFVVCLSRKGIGEFSTDDPTLGRLHEVLAPEDSHDMPSLFPRRGKSKGG